MENESSSTSLLSTCQTCQSKCCHKLYFPVTAQEHDRIVATGAPDHFGGVFVNQTQYYINDYQHGKCAYLDNKGRCSIEEVKPDICKAYPAKPVYNFSSKFLQIDFDYRCPATKFLPQEFKIEAEQLIRQRLNFMNPDIHFAIKDAWDDRYNSLAQENTGAKVTLPPALQ